MKAREELVAEALALELRARDRRMQRLRDAGTNTPPAMAEARLFVLPDSIVTLHPRQVRGMTEVHRMTRWIEARNMSEGEGYQLVEAEWVTDAEGHRLRSYDPFPLAIAGDAFEILAAGYLRLDEDRVRERVEPLAERAEATGFAEPVTPAAVAEVEATVADLDLSAAARLRVRADAIALLEGRLEAGDFVARAVERQEYFHRVPTVAQRRSVEERIEVA